MEWISVKDKLPKYNEVVLLATHRTPFCRFGHWLGERKGVEVGKMTHSDNSNHFEYKNGRTGSDNDIMCDDPITHWMPLPKPPKKNGR